MGIEAKEKTALTTSVGADARQSIPYNKDSISESSENHNPEINSYEELLREMNRRASPDYLHTISMRELYQTVYNSRKPIIDGLLYSGAYILAGAPKIGKSFLVAQIAYQISTGQKLWDYEVHQGTVLYLALEDDFQRLQSRLFRMFGVNDTEKLFFAIAAKQLGKGLDEQLARDENRLIWNLDHAELELWKESPDPILEAIQGLVTARNGEWAGSPTELVAELQMQLAPNMLTKHLNVNAGRLLNEYEIRYENKTKHEGRRITLKHPVG